MPYSKHLEYVAAHAYRFLHLLPDTWLNYSLSKTHEVVLMGCWGHDLIEDARTTYNDVKQLAGKDVADIVWGCTEDAGRTREERHSEAYYARCAANKLSVFVKLCDIMANVTYSILTKSSMYEKHLREHEKTMKYLYRPEFEPMYKHLNKLFEVCTSN